MRLKTSSTELGKGSGEHSIHHKLLIKGEKKRDDVSQSISTGPTETFVGKKVLLRGKCKKH